MDNWDPARQRDRAGSLVWLSQAGETWQPTHGSGGMARSLQLQSNCNYAVIARLSVGLCMMLHLPSASCNGPRGQRATAAQHRADRPPPLSACSKSAAVK